jgi:hypothetical protein
LATRTLTLVVATLGVLAARAVAQPSAPIAPADPYEPDLAPPMSVTPSTWEPGYAPPPVLHKLHVSLGVGLRFTNLDLHDDASKMQLLDYGWASARSPAMGSFSGEIEYLLAPIIDVGVAFSSARAEHAAGIDYDDRVRTGAISFSAVARMHWSLQRPFIPEPRVDVGVVRRTIEVHTVEDSDTLPFLRAGFDWRLGTRRGGVQVSAGYMLTGRAASGRLDPAVGGLDVGLSPYFRF